MSTTVLPAATAGAIFHDAISNGKFQGISTICGKHGHKASKCHTNSENKHKRLKWWKNKQSSSREEQETANVMADTDDNEVMLSNSDDSELDEPWENLSDSELPGKAMLTVMDCRPAIAMEQFQ